MASGHEALFQTRNLFYLGNYQGCVDEAATVSDEECALEKQCLIYRAYIGMGNTNIVMSKVSEAAEMDLQAIKLLAAYLSSGGRAPALERLGALMEDSAAAQNTTLQVRCCWRCCCCCCWWWWWCFCCCPCMLLPPLSLPLLTLVHRS